MSAPVRSMPAVRADRWQRPCRRSRSTPIEGQVGWLVYNKLKDRLHASGTGETRYRLNVELDDDIVGFGIRGDRAVTRERRSLRARYQLVDVSTGAVVLDATAGSDAGIDVVSSEYATVAAEQTAAERLSDAVSDQIVNPPGRVRLADALRRGESGQGQHRPRGRRSRPKDSILPVPRCRRGRSRVRWATGWLRQGKPPSTRWRGVR